MTGIHATKQRHSCDNITGKDILLICEHFYNYDIAVRDELLRLGAKSVYLHDIKWMSGSFRERITFIGLIRWLRNPRMRSAWTKELIRDIGERTFDTMLCIPLPTFTKDFMNWIRQRNPYIKTFLFLWDKQSDLDVHFSDYFPLFDKVVSFDRDDARKFGINYFPDFYLPTRPIEWDKCKYDISFVGTCNSRNTRNRAALMDKVQQFCNTNGLICRLYLRFYGAVTQEPSADIGHRIRHFFTQYRSKHNSYSKFKMKYQGKPFYYEESIDLNTVNEIYRSSRVILDLNHRDRQGMTINAITALALGKKLITTNYRIKEESFYTILC